MMLVLCQRNQAHLAITSRLPATVRDQQLALVETRMRQLKWDEQRIQVRG
jgi:hypothetical protein